MPYIIQQHQKQTRTIYTINHICQCGALIHEGDFWYLTLESAESRLAEITTSIPEEKHFQ